MAASNKRCFDPMKKLHLPIALLCCSVFLFACSDQANSGANETSHPVEEPVSGPGEMSKPILNEIPFDPAAVYVDRMYATSTGGAGAEYLLDGDRETFWEAMPGAGADEGVMLYFDPAVSVGSIVAHKAVQRPGIQRLQYFVNGVEVDSKPAGEAIDVNTEVASLFIRIERINGGSSGERILENGRGSFESNSPDIQIGLSEIEFMDEKGSPIVVRPLHLESGSLQASSTLAPAEAYHADYLFDSRKEFGWAEGKEDEGKGESITFNFDQPVRIQALKLWNGYQRSDRHFGANARIKTLNFSSEGVTGAQYPILDQQGAQEITLEKPLEGKSFIMSVEEVFKGKSYPDLLLSELRFFDGQRWFGMRTKGETQRQNALREKVNGTVLEPLLDRMVRETRLYEDPNEEIATSLVLRSNSSFVLYRTESQSTQQVNKAVNQVADGNWSIEDLGNGRARVKLFGKLHRIYEKAVLYKGSSSSDKTRIFSEYLNIFPDKIIGEKLVDSLKTKAIPGDMVEINKYLEDYLVDLKYMTNENFLESAFYTECMTCLVRREVAEALQKVEQTLAEEHDGEFRLLFWDCFRPPVYQQAMWDAIKDPRYVADPSKGGSSHGKGTAVDLTLASRPDGDQPIDMGTEFDHFGEEAHHSYTDLSEEALNNRKMLKSAMEAAGFKALKSEWWHYSFASKHGQFDYEDFCDY